MKRSISYASESKNNPSQLKKSSKLNFPNCPDNQTNED